MKIPFIYNNITDYIMILNSNKEIIFCNESVLNRLNYSQYEVINLKTSEIIKDEKIKKVDKETTETLELYSKSQEIVKINSKISIDNFNGEQHIFIVGQEINEKTYTMEMLEAVLDNISNVTFLVNEEGKYLYVNKAFTDILNKKREEIIGTYNKDNWRTDVYEVLDKNNNEVFEIKSPKIFNEVVTVGENTVWYKSYKAPIFDENKKPKYVVGSAQNVNLAKVLSEELYKNYNIRVIENHLKYKDEESLNLEEILTKIGENILDYTKASGLSIMLYDKQKEGLVPSIKLKRAYNYLKNIDFIHFSKKDVESEKYKDYFNCFIKPDQIKNTHLVDYTCIDELQYSGNYTMELYNEFIGVVSLSYDKGNDLKFNSDEYMKYICNKVAMIIKNITLSYEIAKENQKRKYTEKELEHYLDIAVDLVSIVGIDGKFKRISSNWNKVLGWTEKELMSMKINDIIHPEELEKFKKQLDLDDLIGQITRHVIPFRHKNGNYIYLEWSSEYISEEGVFVTTARDLSASIEKEQEKRKLEEAMQLEVVKNEFFSNISHEFRTPINIILGTMQVINKNIENDNININSLKKYTNYIKQNSYRLLRLVNNLIDISKMDIGMYELRCSNQNIINIVEDITLSVADYTKENKINLIFDTDNEEVITYCDPDKIERIMLNILSNAIKYTKENGNIEVEITTNDDEISVSIKDDGLGIPNDKLDIIFDRFGQVDETLNRRCEGSGIGLSLVKNLVEMHGGNIRVISEVNKGSEFIFTIPIKVQEENDIEYDQKRKCNHVERCDIEFSDIYSV